MEQSAQPHDFMINIPMSMARRLFESMTPESGDDYFRLQVSIQMGYAEEQRKIKARAESQRRDEERKAAELAKPLSKRGTRDECGVEFNRLRRLYNLSWQPEFDLQSIGGIIIYASSGDWIGTTWNKDPRNCLEVIEEVLKTKPEIIGEPFVGPLYEHTEDEE